MRAPSNGCLTPLSSSANPPNPFDTLTLSEDLAVNGSFIRTFHGSHLALGFRGPKDFIERGFNLCRNHSITKGRLHWKHDRLAYILTSEDLLRAGLAAQFYGELILAGVGELSTDRETMESTYDEAGLMEEARRRADASFEEIEPVDFLSSQSFTLGHVYTVNRPETLENA